MGAAWLGATYGDLKVADGSPVWRRRPEAAGAIGGNEDDALFRGRRCGRRVWARRLERVCGGRVGHRLPAPARGWRRGETALRNGKRGDGHEVSILIRVCDGERAGRAHSKVSTMIIRPPQQGQRRTGEGVSVSLSASADERLGGLRGRAAAGFRHAPDAVPLRTRDSPGDQRSPALRRGWRRRGRNRPPGPLTRPAQSSIGVIVDSSRKSTLSDVNTLPSRPAVWRRRPRRLRRYGAGFRWPTALTRIPNKPSLPDSANQRA